MPIICLSGHRLSVTEKFSLVDAKRNEIFHLREIDTMLALFANGAWEIFPNKWSNHGCKKPNAYADYEHLHNRAKP